MPTKILVGTGLIIIGERDEILLVKDRNEKRGGKGGKWGIVGGMLEDGLTFSDNALKEALEETGYKVEITGLVGIYQHVDDTYNRISIIYKARPIENNECHLVDEISEVRWFKTNEIPYNDLRFPHNEEMINDALAGISDNDTSLNMLKLRYL